MFGKHRSHESVMVRLKDKRVAMMLIPVGISAEDAAHISTRICDLAEEKNESAQGETASISASNRDAHS